MCHGASPIECAEATRMWLSHCLETDGQPSSKRKIAMQETGEHFDMNKYERRGVLISMNGFSSLF